ncbi:hypothetical protein N7468_006987 [Penicillium chermesinum]|uniref:Uncharacterized protein n=1 Tax=Penicillium chermesinum TaxID=63820 RepID=A0A9W9NT87_9EURO|nr:uncharacterized protein N7468_006987 [Penicillium chermesinum]KAJ5225762.1 hypothetical protein N7468_006987 [Penicillium chermesinum]KAJ6161023.1 hypothetical protein N7470_004419 [Penicillium chermesinum]
MSSMNILALGSIALFSFIHSSLSLPSAPPQFEVLVRNESYAYNPSEELRNEVLARRAELPFAKRDYATVQICTDASCTNCHTVWDAEFTTASACISAANTECMIISNLNQANIEYWSSPGCHGRNSHYGGCPGGTNAVGSPDTQSIGVHPGC